MTYLETTCR